MASQPTVTVLDPSGHVFQEDVGLARRLDDLAGQTVGLLDDGLAFSDAFLERIGELLEERAGVSAVIARQKPNLSAPAPKPMLEELVNKVDFAVVGVGG